MTRPDPELIDEENPEWTDEMFAKAIPFSALPAELQALLSQKERVVRPEPDEAKDKQSAA